MYLQSLIENDLLPENCIVYIERNIIESTKDEVQSKDCHLYKSIMELLKKHNINYRLVLEKDINSDLICNTISEMPQKIFIYSGYGGYILKPHLFSLGKQFLHVHAGFQGIGRHHTPHTQPYPTLDVIFYKAPAWGRKRDPLPRLRQTPPTAPEIGTPAAEDPLSWTRLHQVRESLGA